MKTISTSNNHPGGIIYELVLAFKIGVKLWKGAAIGSPAPPLISSLVRHFSNPEIKLVK